MTKTTGDDASREAATRMSVRGPSPSLDDLTPNPRNPREGWKADQIAPFRESLRRFGDLGGVVFNRTTGQLVGGHKRVEVFRASAEVRIEIAEVREVADAQGTVAHGYVIADGNRFAYREVEWSPEIEAAANLAANRWGAEWAWQLVSETLQGIADPELLGLTGFAPHELENLLAADWMPDAREALPGKDHGHLVKLSEEQHATLRLCKVKLCAEFDAESLTDPRVIAIVCERFLA